MTVFLISDIYLGMKFAGYPGVQERLVGARFDALKRCVDIPNEQVPIPLKSSSCSDLFRPAVPKVIDQSFRNIPTR